VNTTHREVNRIATLPEDMVKSRLLLSSYNIPTIFPDIGIPASNEIIPKSQNFSVAAVAYILANRLVTQHLVFNPSLL
jgi:hypothetical protein